MPGGLSRTAVHSRRRALAKTLCYRLLMVAITVCIAWLVVGDLGDAVNIGLLTNVLKTGTYYAYERLWDRVRWGVSTAA